ncbi:helix-turn-helix protein [Mycoplasma testudineum]|uniref:Helix-turn-helix protein n=1 Tax=Mycoplasma testudineum TaxID=244584 RepID=A0A4V3C319_9MOLU|nr:IS3 family transposase [Mycoplasma testudineum]TDO20389.1 helix-turn-helix protein [Mycoplasma testudineum]
MTKINNEKDSEFNKQRDELIKELDLDPETWKIYPRDSKEVKDSKKQIMKLEMQRALERKVFEAHRGKSAEEIRKNKKRIEAIAIKQLTIIFNLKGLLSIAKLVKKSSYYYNLKEKILSDEDKDIIDFIVKKFKSLESHKGYRMITIYARDYCESKGYPKINQKKVRRIMRENNLFANKKDV